MLWDLVLRPLHRKLGAISREEYGPMLTRGIDELRDIRFADGTFAPFDAPYPIPRGRREAVEVYGHPGSPKLDRRWERRNMVVARDLVGAPLGKLYVHRKSEACLREALRRTLLACPGYKIERLGCFNYRPQRHDPTRPLSYHAFGVAIDVDPEHNQARRAPDVEPFSEAWYDIWPRGLPQAFVRAWESCGWSWGGRWANWRDPMHFELVR